MSSPTPIGFDAKLAASYDQRAAFWAPARHALEHLMRVILANLPADARILCVGAGTGAELLALAAAFPGFSFTAVEPSGPMLDICRAKVEAEGFTARCTFHEGYLDSLAESEPFHAATSLLVSQFILDTEARTHFFREIARRLRPAGVLITSDLAGEMTAAKFEAQFEIWLRMQFASGVPAAAVEQMRAAYGKNVAVIPPAEIESIVAAGGFSTPVLIHQTLLIHAWSARRAA